MQLTPSRCHGPRTATGQRCTRAGQTERVQTGTNYR